MLVPLSVLILIIDHSDNCDSIQGPDASETLIVVISAGVRGKNSDDSAAALAIFPELRAVHLARVGFGDEKGNRFGRTLGTEQSSGVRNVRSTDY